MLLIYVPITSYFLLYNMNTITLYYMQHCITVLITPDVKFL